MRLEYVQEVTGTRVITNSGVKIPLGNAPHKVGDPVWVEGNYVFGHNSVKNSPVVVSVSVAGYPIITCNTGYVFEPEFKEYASLFRYDTLLPDFRLKNGKGIETTGNPSVPAGCIPNGKKTLYVYSRHNDDYTEYFYDIYDETEQKIIDGLSGQFQDGFVDENGDIWTIAAQTVDDSTPVDHVNYFNMSENVVYKNSEQFYSFDEQQRSAINPKIEEFRQETIAMLGQASSDVHFAYWNVWKSGVTYSAGTIVYRDGSGIYYRALVDTQSDPSTSSAWGVAGLNPTSSDIEKVINNINVHIDTNEPLDIMVNGSAQGILQRNGFTSDIRLTITTSTPSIVVSSNGVNLVKDNNITYLIQTQIHNVLCSNGTSFDGNMTKEATAGSNKFDRGFLLDVTTALDKDETTLMGLIVEFTAPPGKYLSYSNSYYMDDLYDGNGNLIKKDINTGSDLVDYDANYVYIGSGSSLTITDRATQEDTTINLSTSKILNKKMYAKLLNAVAGGQKTINTLINLS